MKLHLPLALRNSLLAVLSIILPAVTEQAKAGVRHPDVALQTYTDFAQNKGRYVVGARVNALVDHIRKTEGGISINYTDGQDDFYIPYAQGMINFSSVLDSGAAAMVGPTFMATVSHNVQLQEPFGEREVGQEHAIRYGTIDMNTGFRITCPDVDYMLQRRYKVVTDVVWNPVSGITDSSQVVGQYVYHAGGGTMGDWVNGEVTNTCEYYQYLTGGIMKVNSRSAQESGGAYLFEFLHYGEASEGASDEHPLPNAVRVGDSGSPVYIYNDNTGQYEYYGSQAAYAGNSNNWTSTNIGWLLETLESYNKYVDMSNTSEVHLNAIDTLVATENSGSYQAKIYEGKITDGNGNVLVSHRGLHSSNQTFWPLNDWKDTQNWYHYLADEQYAEREDMFYTENLIFKAPAGSERSVVLNATVDLGAGYAEFNGGRYVIKSESGESNCFNHAGYVINEGAEVHLQLVNPSDDMTEWRKIGAGDLYIDGSGDTNALLNLGGTGKTYLQQKNGYAAYNVLVNTGATVVINDVGQIVRDFTFGAGGGTLDMNGNSMDWYESSDAAGRFTINALTEEAMIANDGTAQATLTYKQAGNNTFLGSFRDSDTGSLVVNYNAGGTWTLHSIHTDMTHHADSALVVTGGKVILSGSKTVHGMGSVDGLSQDRLVVANDWHYADASMHVRVQNGATFELGSHARLDGTVTVENGATFIVREGVQNQYEYVEGGTRKENTSKYADFYGLKSDVCLNGSMRVEYSSGVGTVSSLEGNLSGAGTLTVALGNQGGVLELNGDNSAFTGSRTLQSGGIVAESNKSLGARGASDKWVIESGGWVATKDETGQADILSYIDTRSVGSVLLTHDEAAQIDFSAHGSMFLGAYQNSVQYGEAGTMESLSSVNGAWRFGGGNGELVVNYQLSGDGTLLVGNGAGGVVTLTNTNENFSGDIYVRGATLNMASNPQNRVVLEDGQFNIANKISGAYQVGSNISGSGSAGLRFTDDVAGNSVSVEDGCSVAVRLLEGGATLNTGTFSNKIILDDGTQLRVGTAGATLGSELETHGAATLLSVGDYTVSGTLSGDGVLTKASSGTMRLTGSANVAELRIVYGTVRVEGNNDSKQLKGNIYVGTGAALDMGTAGACDQLDYDATGKSITVDGGSLNLNSTRQTLGDWKLILSNGASVSGTGDSYDASAGPRIASLDINQDNSTIYATEGSSTISAVTRLRYGNHLNYDVSEGAMLTVSGLIHADGLSDEGSIAKNGGGTLVLSAANTYADKTTVNAGTLMVASRNMLGSGVAEILGGCLELSAVQSGNVAVSNTTGTGTLALHLSATTGNTLAIDSNFTGTTYVKQGRFAIDGSSFSNSLKLGDNTIVDLTGSRTQSVISVDDAASFVMGNGAQLAVTGNISGAGALTFSGAGDVKLASGAKLNTSLSLTGTSLTFEGTGSDAINYGTQGEIILNNASMSLGTTRQTMARWNLKLSNGASVTGSGSSYSVNNTTGTAALDFNANNATIYATAGESTISAVTRLRGGNNLNYDVSAGAMLTVDGLIHSDNNANAGSITKNGTGTLVLSGVNTYANKTTVNAGLLRTYTKGALGASSVSVNRGGTLEITGNENKVLDVNVAVNAGGVLRFAGSGADMLDYDANGKSITLNGGSLAFESTRQTMGSWTLTLSNGAAVTGTGGRYTENGTHYASLDINQNNSTIYATAGANSIEAITRLRYGNNLNYEVSDGAELTVSGLIHADDKANEGNVTKLGKGTLVLSGTNTYAGTTSIQAGSLQVANSGALGTSTVELADGSLVIAADAAASLSNIAGFTMTGGIMDLSNFTFGTTAANAIALKSGATYTFSDGVIDLGDLEAGITYQIFDLSAANTTLSGWNLDTLDASNFSLGNNNLADMGNVSLVLGETGTFSYNVALLYWAGGEAGNWNTTDANWDATPHVAGDASVPFNDSSSVVFNSTATVNISEAVEAYDLTITDGAVLALTMDANAGFTAGEVVVDNGTLKLGSQKNWSGIASVTIEQKGVLQLESGSSMNNAADATEIMLRGGKITLLNGNGGVLRTNLTVDESGTIRGSYNGNTGTIEGTITGSGILTLEAENTYWNNPVRVKALISDLSPEEALGLHITNGTVIMDGTNTYTGGTVIDADGKLTITTNRALGGSATNGTLGKVSGAGTLVLDLGSNGTAYATGTGDSASLGAFTGTVDIKSGKLRIGPNDSIGRPTDLSLTKLKVRENAILETHFGYGENGNPSGSREWNSVFELMHGSTLRNDDGNTKFAGTIRFNVNDDGTFNEQGTVHIAQNWNKELTFSALLEGDGTVEFSSANHGKAVYRLTGEHNSFEGVFKTTDRNANDTNIVELHLGSEGAAQYADINLASATARSYLMLDSDATINGLYGANAVQAQGAARTLTVSEGDYMGSMQDSTGKLSLKKKGEGTLKLSGANTYTGTTTVEAGTLSLQGAGQLGKGDVSVAAGAALVVASAENTEWASISSADGVNSAAIKGATITQTADTRTLRLESAIDGTKGTLDNSLLQIAAMARLTVEDMIISSSSHLSGAAEGGTAQVQLSSSTIKLGSDNDSVSGAETITLGTLSATGSSGANNALALNSPSRVLTVNTDIFSHLSLMNGSDFMVDFGSLLSSAEVMAADFLYLDFGETVSADWSTAPLTGTWLDYQLDAYYQSSVTTGAAVPNTGLYFDVRDIPEPTTATLSLLALAALAARRRRKK